MAFIDIYAIKVSVWTRYKTDYANGKCNQFEEGIGTKKSFKARIVLKDNAVPKFYKSRSVPFAQLQTFQKDAERMVTPGIWKPIQFSDWVSPIVLITKPDFPWSM